MSIATHIIEAICESSVKNIVAGASIGSTLVAVACIVFYF